MPMPEFTCPACGGHNVSAEKTFDHFCTMSETTHCTCNDCGEEWMNDTAV